MKLDLDPGSDRIVIYERDAISEREVEGAVNIAGVGAVHLASADALVPSLPVVNWRRFPSRREGAFRDFATGRAEALAAVATTTADLVDALRPDGLSLCDVSLIEWQYATGRAIQREWIAREVGSAPSVTRVWIVPGPAPYAAAFASDVAARLNRSRSAVWTVIGTSGTGGARLEGLRLKNGTVAAFRSLRDGSRALATRGPRIEAKTRPRVLFAESFPKTAKLAAAVAREVEQAGDVDVWFVVTRADTLGALQSFGLKRLRLLGDLTPASTHARAFRAQRRAVRAAHRLQSLGSGGAALGAEFALSTAAVWRHASSMITQWNDLVSRLRPDVVASTSQAGSFARAAMSAGHRIGADSFFIQHGLLGHDAFESRVLARRQLLWGEWDRRRRIDLGFPAEALMVTGSPSLEDEVLHAERGPSPWTEAARLKVLYVPSLSTGQWVSPVNAAIQLDEVMAAVQAVPGAQLVIKTHPSDRSPLYEAAAATASTRVIREGMAAAILQHADAVIVSTSTAGLEACALDKPVILLRTEGVRVFRQYADFDAVLVATGREELRRHLEELRANGALRDSLRERRRVMKGDLFNGLRPGAVKRMAAPIVEAAVSRLGARTGKS